MISFILEELLYLLSQEISGNIVYINSRYNFDIFLFEDKYFFSRLKLSQHDMTSTVYGTGIKLICILYYMMEVDSWSRDSLLDTFRYLSPRFKNFGSSRNSLNPTLGPDLRLNSDDNLCHVMDSCKIFGST